MPTFESLDKHCKMMSVITWVIASVVVSVIVLAFGFVLIRRVFKEQFDRLQNRLTSFFRSKRDGGSGGEERPGVAYEKTARAEPINA
jgi:uncharacterized membrane protein YqiK